ncbi:protein kinase domain-containing protein [Roseibium marinum]|uniref:Serine/threonine-protein kinase n=1 Tax=Roseibium marinum TaxID=281252 RepID=A0A2S3UXX9_9HYPH|nr:protein kinase [Roseibium marinum]POF32309.1 serine/threonine-protein kinase [Roseibium marinum]
MSKGKLPKIIEFNRPSKYKPVKVLGGGACGQTVHIRDEDMNIDLVAKKYKPIVAKSDNPSIFFEFLARFRDEARILFRINHKNIVRVFNFYDYEEFDTSYIIMEYISGADILDYLNKYPMFVEKVFEQVIDAFAHLQENNVLHRDIRPANILVNDSGIVKVIDFGFGKLLENSIYEKDKSISLNWWCVPPEEISDGKYDAQTEVYFVGKLFQKAIEENNLSEFAYMRVLHSMCMYEKEKRPKDFAVLRRLILEGKFEELKFSDEEIEIYRNFSNEMGEVVASIYSGAKYNNDMEDIEEKLSSLYRSVMLESNIPDCSNLIRIFVFGGFRYYQRQYFDVKILKEFIELLRGLSNEKKSIVMANLYSRFDAAERVDPEISQDDEIPF